MSKRLVISILLCLAINVNIFTKVYAEEITVSGNGATSNNEVHVDNSNSTNVSQSNTNETKNSIENGTNTGENNVTSNQGDTAITTGESKSITNVSNNTNANITQNSSCCINQDNSTYKIDGNGANSSSIINADNSSVLNSTSSNNITINNNISVTANTGENKASNNNGNVVIKTGDIISSVIVSNNTNFSAQSLSLPQTPINVSIKNNAANSKNAAYINVNKNLLSHEKNETNITNTIFSILNTGKNEANGNSGDVLIGTGSILSIINVSNNANLNFLHADCECEGENTPPTPTVTPPPSPQPCRDNCGSNPTNGSVGGASASSSSGGGEVLPATGSYLTYLITILALITFFAGMFLRYSPSIRPEKNN